MPRAERSLNPVSHEELKGFLLHDDPMVRETIAFYLHESWSEDDDLVPLVLEGCRRFGEEPSFVTLGLAGRFRMSVPGLVEAVKELERSQPPFVEEWLACAPLPLIQSHLDLLRSVLSFRASSRIERRRSFGTSSTSELWERLTAIAQSFDARGSEIEEERQLQDVLDALGSRETQGGALEKLRELDRLPGHTLKACLIELAGAMKLAEMVPILVDYLGVDDDVLAEKTVQALSRSKSPDIVRLIGERYLDRAWDFRLFAIHALQTVKTPSSEAKLRDLLDREDDPALRGRIFDALRFHFTEEAAERIRSEIREPTSWMLEDELKKALYVNAVVLGRDDPEAVAWLDDVETIGPGAIFFDIPVMDFHEGPLENGTES